MQCVVQFCRVLDRIATRREQSFTRVFPVRCPEGRNPARGLRSSHLWTAKRARILPSVGPLSERPGKGLEQVQLIGVRATPSERCRVGPEAAQLVVVQLLAHDAIDPPFQRWPLQAQRLDLRPCPGSTRCAVGHQKFARDSHLGLILQAAKQRDITPRPRGKRSPRPLGSP